jgi:hypothetical protein
LVNEIPGLGHVKANGDFTTRDAVEGRTGATASAAYAGGNIFKKTVESIKLMKVHSSYFPLE